jgi:single-strand DNA-binding protein
MFNQATILGRLGKDPEARTMPNGRAVCNFSLATSERWKDKDSGEQKEKTEWHNCTAYARVGEIVAEYVKKGDLLFVQGSLQTRKWQDKEGKDRYTTEINVRDIKLMPNTRQEGQDDGSRSNRPAAARDENEFNDDIPF